MFSLRLTLIPQVRPAPDIRQDRRINCPLKLEGERTGSGLVAANLDEPLKTLLARDSPTAAGTAMMKTRRNAAYVLIKPRCRPGAKGPALRHKSLSNRRRVEPFIAEPSP